MQSLFVAYLSISIPSFLVYYSLKQLRKQQVINLILLNLSKKFSCTNRLVQFKYRCYKLNCFRSFSSHFCLHFSWKASKSSGSKSARPLRLARLCPVLIRNKSLLHWVTLYLWVSILTGIIQFFLTIFYTIYFIIQFF